MNKSTLSVFAGLFGLSFAKSKSGNSNESNYTATVHLNYKIQNVSGTDIDGYFAVEQPSLLMEDCFDVASAWNSKYPIHENTHIIPDQQRDPQEYLDEFIKHEASHLYASVWQDYLEAFFSWYVENIEYGEIPFLGFLRNTSITKNLM